MTGAGLKQIEEALSRATFTGADMRLIGELVHEHRSLARDYCEQPCEHHCGHCERCRRRIERERELISKDVVPLPQIKGNDD